MTWARLEESFAEHPKVADLSDASFRAHVSAICYSSRTLSNGFVPGGILGQLRATKRVAVELVAAGLWEVSGKGFLIHDYLEYNPSRDDVEQRRLLNSAVGSIRHLIAAALSTGARASELSRLRICDLDPVNGSVFIAESKSGKSRHIPLTSAGLKLFCDLAKGRSLRSQSGLARTGALQTRRCSVRHDGGRIPGTPYTTYND